MTSALDQKGLEAATDAYNEFECGSDVDHVRKIVRAYLSTVIPEKIAGLVERLERLAGEMERHLGPPEMAPGPDADDLREAATLIERLAASQAALGKIEKALEETERYFASCPKMTPRHAAETVRQIRALIDQPSTEGGTDGE